MVESTQKPLVLITGVSGYLGSHVALVFLRDGSYRVRGTVRSTGNQKKIEPLRKAFGDLFDQMELVEADLTNK
jgi:nucleoside-diphosphate-sugar epimerase